MEMITSNMENITFATLFVGLLVYTIKKSDEREALMREQLNKTVPILDGILKRLDGIERVVIKDDKEDKGGEE